MAGLAGRCLLSGMRLRAFFFSQVYRSAPRNYAQPEWMLSASFREVELDCSPFSMSEVARVIKRMKIQSAPSPFDRVGYL